MGCSIDFDVIKGLGKNFMLFMTKHFVDMYLHPIPGIASFVTHRRNKVNDRINHGNVALQIEAIIDS